MTVVIDASASLTWCFRDEARADLDRLLLRIRTDGAHAPLFWRQEIANILVTAARRKRLSEDGLRVELLALLDLPIAFDAIGASTAIAEVVSLAISHRLTVYDATYLELALRRSLPLATLDNELRAAALRLRVPLIPDTLP